MARRKNAPSTPDNAPSVAQQAASRARAARAEAQAQAEAPASPPPAVSSGTPSAPRPRAGGGNISAASSSPSARRAARARAQAEGSAPSPRRSTRSSDLDLSSIEDALRHPHKFPTEEQLHAQYGYVLRDLRSMGLLAASLVVVLILLATLLPG